MQCPPSLHLLSSRIEDTVELGRKSPTSPSGIPGQIAIPSLSFYVSASGRGRVWPVSHPGLLPEFLPPQPDARQGNCLIDFCCWRRFHPSPKRRSNCLLPGGKKRK